MKLIFSNIFLLSGIFLATESDPIQAAAQKRTEAEAKAVKETHTKAKAANTELPPDLLQREAISDLLRQEAESTSCANLIPGLKRFQCGVDGAKLDLISLGEGGGEDGFRNPIVYFSCDEGKKTNFPPPHGKNSYDEPDQIEGISAIPGDFSQNKASVIQSHSDVRKFMATSAGVGSMSGSFSLSASYQQMSSTVMDKKKSLASSKRVVPVFRARMLPSISLKITPHVEKYIKTRLTPTFEEDPASYRDFIAQWGTHFFQRANFGGVIRVLLTMDSSFAKKKTSAEMASAASATMSGITAKGSVNTSSQSMSSEFQKHTSVTKRILGGEYSVFLKEGFNAWQTTVAESPWLYKGKLMSVHLLIKDAKKRKEMLKAIDEHMMKAQLEAARRMAKKKLLEMMGDQLFREKKLQSYIKKCEELMIKDFPKKDIVLALYKKIENAMLWKKKVEYGIFDGMQEAINGVKDMKKKYGNGVSTQIVVGNLLSDKLEYENHKTWHGKWQNRYLVEIPAGKWLGCLHVQSSWSITGSKGWVGWKNGKMLYEVGWVTPWSGTNGFGMQIKEGNQKSPKSWTYHLRSKTVITSPDGTTEMTGWFDLNRASTRVIYKISKAAAS